MAPRGNDGESPAHERRCASHEWEWGEDLLLAGERGGEGERPVQARLSNLSHYAVAGVKAQAFVRVLF
jgi:hypothetical protein